MATIKLFVSKVHYRFCGNDDMQGWSGNSEQIRLEIMFFLACLFCSLDGILLEIKILYLRQNRRKILERHHINQGDNTLVRFILRTPRSKQDCPWRMWRWQDYKDCGTLAQGD